MMIKFKPIIIFLALLFVAHPAWAGNAEEAGGNAALLAAAQNGDLALVEEYLDKGADINSRDENGRTALMNAAAGGYLDSEQTNYINIVQALLERGAEVNIKDRFGFTALMYAADNNRYSAAEMLLAKGADVNAAENSGATAWVFSVAKGYADIRELLKKNKAIEKYDLLEWPGQYSDEKEAAELVITDMAQWQKLWKRIFKNAVCPEIDFNKYAVVAVFLGVRPTGGYNIEFGAPAGEGRQMLIPYKEIKPKGMVTQALTQPYKLKVFEKKGNIKLRKEKK